MTDSKSRFEAGDLCTVRLTERDAQYLNTGDACYFAVEHIVEAQSAARIAKLEGENERLRGLSSEAADMLESYLDDGDFHVEDIVGERQVIAEIRGQDTRHPIAKYFDAQVEALTNHKGE